MAQQVYFREVRGTESQQIWMHPEGRQAVMALGAGTGAMNAIWQALQQSGGLFDWHELEDLVKGWNPAPTGKALVTAKPPEPVSGAARFLVECSGDVQVLRFDRRQAQPQVVIELQQAGRAPRSALVTLPEEAWLLLVDEELTPQALMAVGLNFDDLARSSHDAKLRVAAAGRPFSALVFPVEEQLSLQRPEWAYDPFRGLQESRVHERRGLRRLADALFAESAFDGFLIVAPPALVSARSSREIDAVVISPFGAVPVELKDYEGAVELVLAAGRGPTMTLRGGLQRTNPIDTMRGALRRFGDLPALSDIRTEARRLGVVLFTHEQLQLSLRRGDQLLPLPHRDGDVLICRPVELAQQLLEVARQHCGNPPRPLLDSESIERLANRLLAVSSRSAQGVPVSLEGMEIEAQLLATESDARRTVFKGSYFGAPLWAKRYAVSSLAVAEDQGAGREVQVLCRLAPLRLSSVPIVYGHRRDEDALWVFVEAGEPRTLGQWLAQGSKRGERLALLRELADLLVVMAALGDPPLVHRALNLQNLRVRPNGRLQVVNFDLAQQRNVSTLMSHERRSLDEDCQAEEVSIAGTVLTPAADAFSLMMLAARCLSSKSVAPPRMALRSNARNSGYWLALCKELGLPVAQSELLRRALGANPADRPSASELRGAMEDWR
jgi:serine/threonine-protein kinase